MRNQYSYPLFSFVLSITIMTTQYCYSMHEVQQESLLCQMPQDIIYWIAEQLNNWEDVNNLGLTCKELDRRVNIPGRRILLRLMDKRCTTEVATFLSKILHMLMRMASKKEFNPIILDLPFNHLGADMPALQQFLDSCSKPPIVSKLKHLDLFENDLAQVPPALARLTGLTSLELGGNQLTDSAIPQLTQLTGLKELHIGGNLIQTIDPRITQLQNLTSISLYQNGIRKEALEILKGLKNLERLGVAETKMTLAEVAHSFATWPGHGPHLTILTDRLDHGGNYTELMRRFETIANITVEPYFG